MTDYVGKKSDELTNKKLWLIDMDGTIYRGNTLFEGIIDFLKNLTEIGAQYVFMTNNPSKNVNDYIDKLNSMGIFVTQDNIFSSADAAALYLGEKFKNKKIYAQGTRSFISGLKKEGLIVTESVDEDISCVLVSYDTELTFEKLDAICRALKKEVPYYATNQDFTCPTEYGFVPDCGSMCFGLEKATGKKPVFIGKPQPFMPEIVMRKKGIKKEQTVIVGDVLYTDIACGINAGIDSLLVLSGSTSIKEVEKSDIKPTYIFERLSDVKL